MGKLEHGAGGEEGWFPCSVPTQGVVHSFTPPATPISRLAGPILH